MRTGWIWGSKMKEEGMRRPFVLLKCPNVNDLTEGECKEDHPPRNMHDHSSSQPHCIIIKHLLTEPMRTLLLSLSKREKRQEVSPHPILLGSS